MRILLAILSVALFGAVAVAVSAPAARSGANATPTPRPRYTPIPAETAPQPPDAGTRLVRTDARLFGRFAVPIEGADVPTDIDLLPGAARDYRAGVHEGIDFPAPAGTAVLAAAAGTIVRIDATFADWTAETQEAALSDAVQLGYTPTVTLDRIRGRQVWIDHGRGIVTRYAHLESVADLKIGARVEAGSVIGAVGSSGYPQGGPHLHLEVRVGDDYFGDGLGGDALVRAVSRLFG